MGQQPVLQITSPADGTVVNPGQTISVVVSATSDRPFIFVGVIGERDIGFSNVVKAEPFQFSMSIPKILNAGWYQLTAVGTTGTPPEVYSEPVSIDVERADIPTKLGASPDRLIFESQGSQIPVRISGRFSDGSFLDVTESTKLTFRSFNTGVATVGSTGMVTAVGVGTGSIVATYAQSVQVTIPITLEPQMLTPSSADLTFGSQAIGTTSGAQTLILTNTSNSSLSILSVAAVGDYAETDNCVSSSPIPVGGTCTVNVTFAPTANGARTGALNIGNSFNVVPMNIPLRGTGIPSGSGSGRF